MPLPPPPNSLRFFGAADVRAVGDRKATAVLAQSKHVAFLAILAAARRALVRRDRLIGLLWPELEGDRARNALSKAIHNCRQTFGEDALVGRFAEEVGLDVGRWSCDLWEFDDAIDRSAHADALAHYQRGEWLEGLHIPDASALEHWIDGERDRLRRRAVAAATALSESSERAGELAGAAEHARLVCALSPFDERALRHRLTLLDRTADRAGAVSAFAEFAARLRHELDAEPAPETLALVEAIRRRTVAADMPAREQAPGVDTMNGESVPALHTGGEQPAASSVPPNAIGTASSVATTAPRPPNPRRRVGWMALAAAALLTIVGVMAFRRDAVAADAPHRVVVIPFENRTNDSALTPIGEMAADMLGAALTRSGVADVVDARTRIRRGLTVANGESAIDADRFAALAVEIGASTLVTGSYYRAGSSLVVVATIRGLPQLNGSLRFAEEVGPLADPREVLRRVERRLLGVVATLRDPRMTAASSATTEPPTYDAYVEYVAGLAPWIASDAATAARHFDRAFELDSNFVGVLPLLYEALTLSGRRPRADSILSRIGARRRLLAPFDQAQLDFLTSFNGGHREAMFEATRRMVALAPHSPDGQWMRGFAATTTNRFDEALEAFAQADLLNGWTGNALFAGIHWQSLALHLSGRHDEERTRAIALRALHPTLIDACRYELRAMTVRRPLAELSRTLAGCAASAGGVDSAWIAETRLFMAEELLAHDRSEDAVRFAEPAVGWLRDRLRREPDSRVWRPQLEFALMLVGAWAEVLPLLEADARALPDNRPPRFAANAGIAAAALGRTVLAEEMLARLDAAAPPPVFHLQRARVLAHLGRNGQAVAELRQAVAKGLSATVFHANMGLGPLRGDPAYRDLVRPRP